MTVAQVQQNPDAYRGALVIWGGRITKVVVADKGSDLYIAREPLDGGERPRSVSFSEGSFIAHSTYPLDPSVYRTGRWVTLAGRIAGIQQAQTGASSYPYPLLDVDQMVLWQRPQPYYSQDYYPGLFWGVYGWPYYWGDAWDDADFGDDGGFGYEGEGDD